MPVVSLLIFFAVSIFTILVGLYIFLIFYNKRSRVATDKFILQASEFDPTVYHNIQLRYWTTNGSWTRIWPNSRCDLYLFDNCLAIVRSQNFIFKMFFAPVLLTSDIVITKKRFNNLKTYKPDCVIFKQIIKQIIKGALDITLTDPVYKQYTIEIMIKGLTNEQIHQLEKIKNWC
jgi:hypothetical protein